jgi:aerobic-type carbon monoxide dehydrogenase small subunit (CoxS/CutS family)
MKLSTLQTKVTAVNDIVKQAIHDDITAIETDSSWESVYNFESVILTKTQLIVKYKEDYTKQVIDKISIAKCRCMDFDDIIYKLNWIKKTIKKGYKTA